MKKQITSVLMATLVFFLCIGFYSQVKAQDIKPFRADFLSVLDLYQEYGAFLQSNKEIYNQYLKHIDKARQMIKELSDKELIRMAMAHANLLDLKSALQDLMTKSYCKDSLSIEPKEMEAATFDDIPNADYPSCLSTSYIVDALALQAYLTAELFNELIAHVCDLAGTEWATTLSGISEANIIVFFIAKTAYEQYKLYQDSYSGAEIQGTYNRIGIHDNNLREHDNNMTLR